MMKAVNTIKIKKGRADEVIERFKTLKGIQNFEGFLGMEVLKRESEADHDEIKVCTSWEDKSYFEAWTNSDSFKAGHAKRRTDGQDADRPVISAELSMFTVAVEHKKEH